MLQAGDKAIPFELPDQNNQLVKLSDYAGQWLVVYFYPKDMTPGCTTEARNFQEILSQLQELKVNVVGISKDSVERHARFAAKNNITFPLLSDEKSDICEQYGVWQEKKLYGRTFWGIVRSTFIINPQGTIARVFPKVKVKTHHQEVLAALKEMMG